MKLKAQIERKESMMSTTNEMNTSKTVGGTQKVFQLCMAWPKGVLVFKGIVYIMKVRFKNRCLPTSENESRQTAEQKTAVKDNNIGMGIVTMNIIAPSLIVTIGKFMTEEWPSRLFFEVTEMLNKKYFPKDTYIFRAMQK